MDGDNSFFNRDGRLVCGNANMPQPAQISNRNGPLAFRGMICICSTRNQAGETRAASGAAGISTKPRQTYSRTSQPTCFG